MYISYINEWVDTEEIDDNIISNDDNVIFNTIVKCAREAHWKKEGNNLILESLNVVSTNITMNHFKNYFLAAQSLIYLNCWESSISGDLNDINNIFKAKYDVENNKLFIELFGILRTRILLNTAGKKCSLTPAKYESLLEILHIYELFYNLLIISLIDNLNNIHIHLTPEDIDIKLNLVDDINGETPNMNICTFMINLDEAYYNSLKSVNESIKFFSYFKKKLFKDLLTKYLHFDNINVVYLTFEEDSMDDTMRTYETVKTSKTFMNSFLEFCKMNPKTKILYRMPIVCYIGNDEDTSYEEILEHRYDDIIYKTLANVYGDPIIEIDEVTEDKGITYVFNMNK